METILLIDVDTLALRVPSSQALDAPNCDIGRLRPCHYLSFARCDKLDYSIIRRVFRARR